MQSNIRPQNYPWLSGIVLSLLALVVAFVVTSQLPMPRQYEARYELRLRDYSKNIDQPESVLNGIELMDADQLVQDLRCRYDHPGVKIWCDPSKKITIRVHSHQPDEALFRAQTIYQHLLDTVSQFGQQMCYAKAYEYQRQINLLRSLPATDSTASLINQFHDRLAILQADSQGGMRYIDVFCTPEHGPLHRTPSRPWVILLSVLSAALFSVILSLYRRQYGSAAE